MCNPAEDGPSSRTLHLLPGNACTSGVFPRAPSERPLRVLILLCVASLAVIDVLPFYFDYRGVWDSLVGYEGSYDTPVGLTAGILGVVVLLVALAGGRAQGYALRPCSLLLRPDLFVHSANVMLLAGVIPWWTCQSHADATDLVDGWGYISGKACKWMMGMCLLPIARQSLWLNAAAAGFPEGVAFHRVTGWWCVAQVVIHSLCYTVTPALDAASDYEDWKHHLAHGNHTRGPECPGEFDGTQLHAVLAALRVYFWPWATRLSVETGEPEPNTLGVFILVGLIGTLAAVALAAFSLPRLRRARYDLFYVVHVPAAAFFIVMGAVHEFQMMVFVVPGVFAYFLDRTDFLNRTATSRFHHVTARVRLMTADWVRVDVAGPALRSEAAYGTQFLYLRVPALGGESHAFSLAARCPSIVIKANGDWTRRLHELAQKQAAAALGIEHGAVPMSRLSSVATDLACEVDGVYGNASPPWRSYSHVLFVGGGVGVAPWLPAIEEWQEMCRLHGATAQTMRLVWCGRTHAELDAMGPYLPESGTTVFLTRASAREDGADAAPEPVSTIAAPAQRAVGRGGTRPWLFAFVGVVSLCLTQMSYFYFDGASSLYVDYEKGCGDGCFEGKPTEAQYLLARALPVACAFVAIAAATAFARWASSHVIASMKCACLASGEGESAGTGAAGAGAQSTTLQARQRSVLLGRPDMAELIDKAVAEVGAVATPAAASPITTGLCVCVCGPDAMSKACKDAVRDARRRHRGVAIGLHVEEPDW